MTEYKELIYQFATGKLPADSSELKKNLEEMLASPRVLQPLVLPLFSSPAVILRKEWKR